MKKCSHENTEMSYGFGRTAGWKGIGICIWCMDCMTIIEFSDDTESMSPDEIEHNRIKREALSALEEMCP
jgi:hypothetical protein